MHKSATNALVALNTIVFIMELIDPRLVYLGGLVPSLVFYRPRTLITYAFLHANFLHLFFNMFFLRILGNRLEERIGRQAFLISYIFLAISVGMLHAIFVLIALPQYANVISIGASGAVMGVLGMSVVYLEGMRLRVVMFPIPIPMNLSIKQLALFILLLETFMGLLNIEPGIAHDAHVFGLILGYIIARGSFERPKRRRKRRFVVTLFRNKKRPRYLREFKTYDYELIMCLREFSKLLDMAMKNRIDAVQLSRALAECDSEFYLRLIEEGLLTLNRNEVIALIITEIFKIIVQARERGDLIIRSRALLHERVAGLCAREAL